MITAKLLLYDYQKPTKRGYPIKILVTGNRKTKPVHLKRYCHAEFWEFQKQEPRRNCPDKQLRLDVIRKKAELEDLINVANKKNMTLNQTVELIKNPTPPQAESLGLLEFYKKRIDELEALGKSTSVYSGVRDQLFNYLLKKDITLEEVDFNFIREFRDWKMQQGMTANGVHVYLRNLRTVFYEARRRQPELFDARNPFEGNMPRLMRTKKRAVEVEDIKRLEEGSVHPRTRLWLLQFYLCGMDLYDLAALRWDQIRGERLTYQRGKLRSTGAEIELRVFAKARNIIQELGTPDDARVFSFIPNPVKDAKRYASFRANLNKRQLKTDSKKLKISKSITTKSARHTFRTIGRRKLVDGDIIMELMGHQGDGVEYIYQDRFTQQQRDEAQARIIGERWPQ